MSSMKVTVFLQLILSIWWLPVTSVLAEIDGDNGFLTDGYFSLSFRGEIEAELREAQTVFVGMDTWNCIWTDKSSGIQNGGLFVECRLRHLYRSYYTFKCPDNLGYHINNLDPVCPGEVHEEITAGDCPGYRNQCPSPKRSNPVNIATGNKFQVETDYISAVAQSLTFRRYFNSVLAEDTPGRYSQGWSSDYFQRIRIQPDADYSLTMTRPDGRLILFNKNVNTGAWSSPDPGVVETIEEVFDDNGNRTGWLFKTADDTVEEFILAQNGIQGFPVKITNRYGQTTTIEYDLPVEDGFDGVWHSPDRITGPFGRTIQIHYHANNKLDYIVDPAGNHIDYVYENGDSGNLVAVVYPDDTPEDTSDNPKEIYHYEDSNYPYHLTGITDENGNRYSTYIYDNQGRATASIHHEGVNVVGDSVYITYNGDTVDVTDVRGETRTYSFDIQHGIANVAGIIDPSSGEGKLCADCGPYKSATYDDNGFPASKTDFNGVTTNYIYNSRGLETLRTEAVGTPVARTISTEWHPEFRLPTKIQEPGRETVFVYDENGLLIERTEREIQ